jgi:hypothetical protein
MYDRFREEDYFAIITALEQGLTVENVCSLGTAKGNFDLINDLLSNHEGRISFYIVENPTSSRGVLFDSSATQEPRTLEKILGYLGHHRTPVERRRYDVLLEDAPLSDRPYESALIVENAHPGFVKAYFSNLFDRYKQKPLCVLSKPGDLEKLNAF